MRGKLAPQNASDGHAEAILAKIENDADSATKKRIAKYGSIDPIYPTPNNWAWTTIGRMSRDWGQKVPDKPFHSIDVRSEEHTSELQSLMRISYAVFCLKKKNSR